MWLRAASPPVLLPRSFTAFLDPPVGVRLSVRIARTGEGHVLGVHLTDQHARADLGAVFACAPVAHAPHQGRIQVALNLCPHSGEALPVLISIVRGLHRG
eukprot:scaffold838_cov251-Pinguiococcus_pyrenoidosus.AAC.3